MKSFWLGPFLYAWDPTIGRYRLVLILSACNEG